MRARAPLTSPRTTSRGCSLALVFHHQREVNPNRRARLQITSAVSLRRGVFFFLRRMQEPLLAMHLNPAARFPAIRFYASLVFRCLINTAVLTSSLLSFSPVAFFPYSSHCHRLFRFILFYLLSSVIFPSLHPFHDSHFSFLNPPFLFFPPYFSNHFFLPSPFLTFSKSLPLNFVSFPFLNFFFHSFLHPSFVHLYSLSLSLSLYTFFTSPFPYRSSFILIFIMS